MLQKTINKYNQLIKDYLNGFLIKELNMKYNISPRHIQKILKMNRIKKRKTFGVCKNLLNKKFGYVTVIKLIESNNRREQGKWLCVCECGNQKIFSGRWLKESKGVHCGCKVKESQRKRYFRGYGEISKTVFNNIKKSAIRRNILFEITIEYVWDLFLKQNRKCKISGLDLFFGKFTYDYNTASLDRIDSSKGYIEGNVQWVHKDVNLMKGSFIEKNFIEYCRTIANYNDLNSIPDSNNSA